MSFTNNDLTFVICAYKESPYLEECILSLKSQTVKSNILIATSTPNNHIETLSEKHNIPLQINKNGGNIVKDWNFAYNLAQTDLVTIAHQDDIYLPGYLESTLSSINKSKQPLIFFTNYYELRDGNIVKNNLLLNIKRLMLLKLRCKCLQSNKFIRRRLLSFGNPICCPSVTYIKNNLPNPMFEEGYLSNMDWQTWENISKLKGSFIYNNKVLMLHRIHSQSTTTEAINLNKRTQEDFEMFCKFWPKSFARRLSKFYIKSEKSNVIK